MPSESIDPLFKSVCVCGHPSNGHSYWTGPCRAVVGTWSCGCQRFRESEDDIIPALRTLATSMAADRYPGADIVQRAADILALELGDDNA